MTVLDPAAWASRRAAHQTRAQKWIGPHLERRVAGVAHPVMDFLFEYYPYSPGRLATWHPGAGTSLAGDVPAEFQRTPYVYRAATWSVDLDHIDDGRLALVLRILTGTSERPAQLNCFGLHEWAMVYRAADTRHSIPLRVSAPTIAETVEGIGLRCTHIDAFRFFTPAATPLNTLTPTRSNQPDMEQPGCLHATMDLYKYAMWFQPYLPGEVVLDCFELAADTRVLDMEASPYDLADYGYAAVRVETSAGRSHYASRQRDLTARGQRLRTRLTALLAPMRRPCTV